MSNCDEDWLPGVREEAFYDMQPLAGPEIQMPQAARYKLYSSQQACIEHLRFTGPG